MHTNAANSNLGWSFWNKVWVITLLYGGLSTLVAVELDRIAGVFPFLSLFDAQALAVVIVVYGTLGLHVVRRGVLEPEQWLAARRFGVTLAGVLAVASAAMGHPPLAVVCLMVVAMHGALPKLLRD